MAYTVLKLITNAYYASGIVARDFQTASGSQLEDGLDLFNEIVTDKFVENNMQPYYEKYDFNAVVGQERYFIADLIEVETLTFFINSVRFSSEKKQRIEYFGSSRADNINSLPFSWHFEREKGGGSIYLYFKPSQAFPLQIWGQFGLTESTFNTDLSLTYDQFYISYLKYALANRLCVDFNYEIPPGVADQLRDYEMMISKQVSPLDLRCQKMSTMTDTGTINWGIANLSGGFTTP